ncbi:MAG TPA: endonuclease III [Candidatus Polarisedimenticolaceae bacterium]|nr:endonuclease III [Candidatus Polarisedimenticolaceae bacterium]
MGGRTDPIRHRARRIVERLRSGYRDADTALHHRSALELLVATILSAQCTDERVNRVTPVLFAAYPDAAAYALADRASLEERIRPTGFYRNKATALIGLGGALVRDHGGRVPDTLDALVALPGVGRKTANVVLGTWFGKPAIPVDTHVKRVSNRLGLTVEHDPTKIELDLKRLLEDGDWTFASHALILHGRAVCHARKPACDRCVLRVDCPFPVGR